MGRRNRAACAIASTRRRCASSIAMTWRRKATAHTSIRSNSLESTLPYRSALIVGAGSGLSASLARLLGKEGVAVALAARDADKLAALCSETGAIAFSCDATDASQVDRLFADIDKARGAPDVV